MLELDGSDAGGQFVRTALAFAALQGRAVRIENVRGARSDPGLGHQHLAVVETMAAICDADVSGARLGAETVRFDPDGAAGVTGGRYRVDIGTAGSIALLFDAAVPLATRLEAPLSITAVGGTDVAWSPPIDHYRRVKLPLLRRFGLRAAVEVDRRGFSPEGGGRATLHLAPSDLDPITLVDRGAVRGIRLYSTEAAALADSDVAARQAGGAEERLGGDRDVVERVERTAESARPGSAIVVRIDFEGSVAGTSALGEPGRPAERVGEEAADEALALLEGTAPVDRHAADQVLPFLALAGGRVRVPAVTDHVASTLELLRAFGAEVALEDRIVSAPE